MRLLHSVLLLAVAATQAAQADNVFSGTGRFDLERPEIAKFVDGVVQRNGLARDDIYKLLAKAEPQPKIIEAISRPAERVIPWWEYRARFLTEQRIREGAEFWERHRESLERVSRERGVAPEYLVAIIGVETFYGRITGKYRVLDALTTLAFDYPPRSTFFLGELESFLLLAREEAVDPLETLGSYAGAMGAPQFMPSSYRRYAVDQDGDSKRDLFGEWDDILGSVANYFREHGWQTGAPVLTDAVVAPGRELAPDARNLTLDETIDTARAKGVNFVSELPGATPVIIVPAEQQEGLEVRIGYKNFHVITRYNRSVRYAMAVHDLAQALAARMEIPAS